MKNKVRMWTVMIVEALPVSISPITILGSIISLANMGAVAEQSLLVASVATIFTVLAGTYSITYLFSAKRPFANQKLASLASFREFTLR